MDNEKFIRLMISNKQQQNFNTVLLAGSFVMLVAVFGKLSELVRIEKKRKKEKKSDKMKYQS